MFIDVIMGGLFFCLIGLVFVLGRFIFIFCDINGVVIIKIMSSINIILM